MILPVYFPLISSQLIDIFAKREIFERIKEKQPIVPENIRI